jgi:hypothetical protein
MLCTVSAAQSVSVVELKANAVTIFEAGSIAASFSAVAKSAVEPALIDQAFAALGPEVQAVARLWAEDDELHGAAPAFRRFLFFEYLTANSQTIAGSSNPLDRLINIDSAVENLIDDHRARALAISQMTQTLTEPVFSDLGNYLLATFPMIPAADKRGGCITCHASKEVGRPYPTGTRVLGYTFVLQPKK